MTTVADTGFPTLQNVAARLDPEGKIAAITEILTKKLPILEDMPWKMGNLPTGHQVTLRQSLPAVSWRQLNQGVAATKSTTGKYTESCGMLEAFARVDQKTAELNGDDAAFRLSEDKAFLQAFDQEFARAVFYESATSHPERIHGFTPRFPASSGYTTSSYVIPVGDSADSTDGQSVWLINWDPENCCGIFPKASKAGLTVTDDGLLTVYDASNNPFKAYQTHYRWDCGLMVADYRYVVRMQWDPDDATNMPDSGKNMYLTMQSMMDQCYDIGPNARFYMSRTSAKKFDAQLASNSQNYLQWVDMNGRRVRSFLGIPVRITDALIGETGIT